MGETFFHVGFSQPSQKLSHHGGSPGSWGNKIAGDVKKVTI
jgi:hypothetical protein